MGLITGPPAFEFFEAWANLSTDIFRSADEKQRGVLRRSHGHWIDEFAAGYSSAGCSPAEPASALPAKYIFTPPEKSVKDVLITLCKGCHGT
jgi:hypothetical protein